MRRLQLDKRVHAATRRNDDTPGARGQGDTDGPLWTSPRPAPGMAAASPVPRPSPATEDGA